MSFSVQDKRQSQQTGQLHRPSGCPCCAGVPAVNASEEMCTPCWSALTAMRACEHQR